jgi:DNA modification methylase
VGIDANNCPERLKQFLFGFNEIFEGRSEKIRKEIENRKRDIEIESPEYLEKLSQMFADTQPTTHREMEIEKSLRGKTGRDIEIESKFSGSVEQGQEAFKRIADSISGSHQDFRFKEQKGQQSIPQWRTNSEIIQDIRQNPRN